ncbi:hypothetical protein [Actinomadura rugatobispora]|uniref:DoxX family membrane protein n=1 Tax=Actinomadura rugatobispora TaxID=1994 RepID=A0ABW0ZV15_9ACTN
MKLRHAPLRLAAGAVILDSGLSKRDLDEAAAAHLREIAAGTYPFLKKLEPRTFGRMLSSGEIALGTALLLPAVPTALAAAGLAAFSSGLLGIYLRTPGMRRPGSLGPTQEGIPMSKDAWMLGIALGLLLDEATRKR